MGSRAVAALQGTRLRNTGRHFHGRGIGHRHRSLRRVSCGAHNRWSILGTAQLSLGGGDRLGALILPECADERVEFGNLLLPLASGELDLVRELLELREGGLLIKGLGQRLRLDRVGHND